MMNSPKRILVLAAAIAALCGACVTALAQGPKILIDWNQMNTYEANHASQLRGADGSWVVTFNSAGFDLNLWKYVASQIGTHIFVSEDRSIGTSWVLSFQFSPRIVLLDSMGRYVSAPGGNGSGIFAPNDKTNWGPEESFAYFNFVPGGPPMPVVPLMTQLMSDKSDIFLKSFSGLWAKAPGGGGSSLVTSASPAEYWDVFRLYKLNGGDSIIRPFDSIAIQSCNGVPNGTLSGGNIVSLDTGHGNTLIPNKKSVGSWETFKVVYPNEYLTSSQIAHVTHAFVYHEFNDSVPKLPDENTRRDWTLSSDLINGVAGQIGRGGIVVLARDYIDISQYPDVLPTHKQRILDALANPNCSGVAFELTAGVDMAGADILTGIDAVCSQHRDCFVLLLPRGNSLNYSSDIKISIAQLKKSPWYRKLNIVLACYDRYGEHPSGVGFLGGSNSIEGALKWALANR